MLIPPQTIWAVNHIRNLQMGHVVKAVRIQCSHEIPTAAEG
jgi:hypothetical protein